MTHCDRELQAFFAGGLCREKPTSIRGPCIKEPGSDIGGRLSIDPTRPADASYRRFRRIRSSVAMRHARRANPSPHHH